MKIYKNLPRENLGFFPTPIVELRKLSNFLKGPRIFMKRDDHTGLAMGGNKTRKLEFLLGDAIKKDADTLITAGAVQSNHCRQTAAAAAVCGLECHLVLGGKKPDHINGNLLLDQLFGANIIWGGKFRKGENIPEIYKLLKDQGRSPYIIPYGGSNIIGAASFIEAVRELNSQWIKINDKLTHIVFASSSGGTHAGLILGKRIYRQNYQILGINIDKDETYDIPLDKYIIKLAEETASHLGLNELFNKEDLLLCSDYTGKGYGIVGELENEAISLLARQEGILLDPVYTARAFGGLIDKIIKKEITKSDTVLFWHTGGNPSIFAYAEELKT